MNLRDRLNAYSRRFAERLFAVYPQWEGVATTEPWPNADPGCFLVEVPSPADPDRRLWIGTDGGEITVGFGPHGWHTHYGSWTGADEETSFAEALEAIADILTDRRMVAAGILNGRAGASTLVAVDEDPELEGYDQIDYISWTGTQDRSIPS